MRSSFFILKIGRFWRLFGLGGSWALGEAWTPTPKSDVRCPMSDTESDARPLVNLVALPNNCSVFPSAQRDTFNAGRIQAAGLGRERTIAEIWAYFPMQTRQLAGTCRLLGRAKSEQSQSSATFFGQLPGIYRATRANNYSVAQLHPPRESE